MSKQQFLNPTKHLDDPFVKWRTLLDESEEKDIKAWLYKDEEKYSKVQKLKNTTTY